MLFSLFDSSSVVAETVLILLLFREFLSVSLTDLMSDIIDLLALKVRFLIELSSILIFLH